MPAVDADDEFGLRVPQMHGPGDVAFGVGLVAQYSAELLGVREVQWGAVVEACLASGHDSARPR